MSREMNWLIRFLLVLTLVISGAWLRSAPAWAWVVAFAVTLGPALWLYHLDSKR